MRLAHALGLIAPLSLAPLACGSDSSSTNGAPGGDDGGATIGNGGGPGPDGGTSSVGPDGATARGALPAGWLFTKGNGVYVSDGKGGGARWVGRGVNVDDIFFCGYDNTLWMKNAQQTLEDELGPLLTSWKPSFLRISLSMASYPTVASWITNPAQYRTPMENVIKFIGTHPNVYVLVTLRSDASMGGLDQQDGDPEATGVPTNATDATYVALVDSFANDPFVLFGLSNEPGGRLQATADIVAAMKHATGVIRAEEDRLGVPHHVVSVQGQAWTSDISMYASAPLPFDAVVYEYHKYPPDPAAYTYANIPVIIGEYGNLTDAKAFFADVETKQIPTLAWDFDPFSNCAPDLVNVTTSATNVTTTPWGDTVKGYLLAHAK